MATIIIPTFYGKDNFVFIPACCYKGNQFRVLKYSYPPILKVEDESFDMPVTITDLPRLEPDGSGKIEVTTGDAATPCIGVFSPTAKRGILVFTVQQIEGENLGLAYEKGEIRLTWPAKREKIYSMCKMSYNTTPWVDKKANIPNKVLEFDCDSLQDFYRIFFENRKIMNLDSTRPAMLPVHKQFEIQCNKFNSKNWSEKLGAYKVGTTEDIYQVWQPGWVGGAMSSYPLMKLGEKTEFDRAVSTLSFLFSTQCESGFFHGTVDENGTTYGDGYPLAGTNSRHLIRKSADVLYFLFKHFKFMEEKGVAIPFKFSEGAKKTADGFVRLFRKYGQFGQFVDVHTGEITIGGSTSAAIAPAGLVEAYRFFKEEEYLAVAKESAELYYQEHLCRGYTTGAPGEIIQCPDSESAFGLLESFVALYDITREKKWLEYAKFCTHYCSSWVVSYNYLFPAGCEFSRLGMKTVGSVFANIQNKHSAPGICTLSGDSLLKLWEWTKEPLYLELAKDIALTVSQYMSTDEKPIYDWDVKKIGDEAHRLPSGFINERVNMSDWEGNNCVGGVFNGSCWPETTNLLILAEVIPFIES